MIKDLLFVGAGGCLGSMARYIVSMLSKHIGDGFPWGTLVVNVLGCFLIGLFYGLQSKHGVLSSHAMLFFTVGFCGGFTTFSTFSNEGFSLLQGGNYWAFALYTLASILLGLLAVALGLWLTK